MSDHALLFSQPQRCLGVEYDYNNLTNRNIAHARRPECLRRWRARGGWWRRERRCRGSIRDRIRASNGLLKFNCHRRCAGGHKIEDANPSVNSGADGAYLLSLLKSELPTNFVGTVGKAGYLPGTVFFKYVGGQLQPSAAGSNNVALVPLVQGADVVFPAGLTIVHVGDGTFEGPANTQFQVPVSGLSWNDNFTPTPLQIATYTKLRVTLFARGVETTGLTAYCNEIVLGDNLIGGNISGGERQPLTATAVDGSFTQITFTFNLPTNTSGAPVHLQILSGKKCDNAASDNDDFEVVSVVGKLIIQADFERSRCVRVKIALTVVGNAEASLAPNSEQGLAQGCKSRSFALLRITRLKPYFPINAGMDLRMRFSMRTK